MGKINVYDKIMIETSIWKSKKFPKLHKSPSNAPSATNSTCH